MPISEYREPLPPRKNDKLFRDDLPDRRNNARLIPYSDGQREYIEGYLRGARVLVNQVVSTDGTDKNYLVYPIFYLYRHHIEIALKRILRSTPQILHHNPTKSELNNLMKHRLDLLWKDLKPLCPAIYAALHWNEPQQLDLDGIDDYIRQLSELDPDSMSFRYSHSKDNQHRSLPAHLTLFNIRHFAEMVDRLVTFIDNIDTAVSIIEDYQNDMDQ